MIRITLVPPRVYLFGRRLHHGTVGLLLILSDLKDWRWWLSDLIVHPESRRAR